MSVMLFGTIRDLDGVPIEGVTVAIYGCYNFTRMYFLSNTTTDANGQILIGDPGQDIWLQPVPFLGIAFTPDHHCRYAPPYDFVWQDSLANYTMRIRDIDWILDAASIAQVYYEIGYQAGMQITYIRRYRNATVLEHSQEGLIFAAADAVRSAYQSAVVVGDIRQPASGTYYESNLEQMAGQMYRVRRKTTIVGNWFYLGTAFGTKFGSPYESGTQTFGIDRIM